MPTWDHTDLRPVLQELNVLNNTLTKIAAYLKMANKLELTRQRAERYYIPDVEYEDVLNALAGEIDGN